MTLQSIVLVIENVVTTGPRRTRNSVLPCNHGEHGTLWFRGSEVAQSTLEYLIIFAVVAVVTIISLTTFDDSIKNALRGFFNAAANKITK